MLNAFQLLTKMEFYKGLSFPDGRPIVVNFRRIPSEYYVPQETRRFCGNMLKWIYGQYSEQEYKNRSDNALFAWLEDLHLIKDEINGKKPEIVYCTYAEALRYTTDEKTKLSRDDIQAMHAEHLEQILEAKKRTAKKLEV